MDRAGSGEDRSVVAGDEDAGLTPQAGTGGDYEVTVPVSEEFRVGEIGYTIVGSQARRDVDGMVAVALEIRAANYQSSDMNLWDASFRILAGSEAYAPTSGLNEVVAGGATGTGTVLFVVPENTRAAQLQIRYPTGERTVPLELRAR